MKQNVKRLAKKLWDYNKLNHKIEKADCIIVSGSHDTRVAERAAELFLNGYADLIVFSGGLGRTTEGNWSKSEAEIFAEVAMRKGVPKDKILIEDKSTNSGENIQFSYKLLKTKKKLPEKVILLQKPYAERRTYTTFMKQWPGKKPKVIVSSPKIKFEEYPNEKISFDEMVNIIVSDTQRIKLYAKKGFQIEQEIPDDVWNAYEQLVEIGYSKYLTE